MSLSSPMNANPQPLSPDRPQGDSAFTITELLVVIAALALLLTLTTVAGTRDQTSRVQCAENLHKIALTTTLLANDNGDQLPSNSSGSAAWPFDMKWELGNTYTNYMSVQTLYCPASGMTSNDNINLWNYAPGGFHVGCYAATLPGTGRVFSTNLNTTLTPQRIQVSSSVWLPTPSAAKRVLFVDNTMSVNFHLPPSPADNFADIQAAYIKHHRTSHMDGLLPAGGNLAMLDGHVEWRKFQLMTIQGGGPSSVPWWWW